MKISASLVLNVGLILSVICSLAFAVQLDPYGANLDAELHCDDCTSGNLIPGGYSLIYFGEVYTSMYVSSNGMLSLQKPAGKQLTFDNVPIIAPYMFDIDTQLVKNHETDGTIFYRTDLENDFEFDEWAEDHFGIGFFTAYSVVVTYDRVKMKDYPNNPKRNTFQAVIHVSHYGDTIACFNYPENGLNWPDSEVPNYPIVGFFSGPDLRIRFDLYGSGNANAVHLDENYGNFQVLGQYCYVVSGLKVVADCAKTELHCKSPSYFPINTPLQVNNVLTSYTKCDTQELYISPNQFTCADVGILTAVVANIGTHQCETYFIPTVNVELGWLNCPSDITVYSSIATTVHWIPPTAVGDCLNVGSESISHRPDDSLFTLGTTIVSYFAYDYQYRTAACTFKVTVLKPVTITYEVIDALNQPINDAKIGGYPDCAYTDHHGLCRVEAPQYRVGDTIPAFNYHITQYSNIYVVPHDAVYIDCQEVKITLVLSPPGFYRSSSGDILQCPPGTYSDTYEATQCISCPIGYYQADPHSTNCDVCPPGFTSGEGATDCYTCSAGYFLNYNTRLCETCPAGSYSCDRALSCEPCPPGSWASAGSESCTYCGAGSYLDANSHTCLSCPFDTFSADRATECTPCPPGSYAEQGSKECTFCEPGFFYDSTSIRHHQCAACPAGTYSNARASECTPCPPGSYSSDGSSTCYYCSAGYYMTSSILDVCEGDCDTCEPCPPGTFSCDRQDHCEPCPPGTWSKIGSSECFSCDAGYYLDIECGCCFPCPPGTFSGDNAMECTPCPPGSWSLGTSTECQFCIAGYYFNAQTLACELCPAGYFSNVRATECTHCPPGSYSFAGSDTCVFCTAGYFFDSQSNSCLPCPAGTTSCDRATYCTACPYGSTSNPGSATCNFCEAGYYFDFLSETCQACPTGTFSGDRATVCTPCPNGFYALPGSATCYSCFAGTYLDVNTGACVPCPAGTVSGDRATECIALPPGIEEEIFCAAGQYFDVTFNQCLTCPVNTYSAPRALSCTPCPAGSYSNEGASVCIFCTAGYYLDFNTCSPCPPNTFSNDRATSCSPCPAGYISDYGSVRCNACPDQTVYQNGFCVPCPQDTFYMGGVCIPCGMPIPEQCRMCPPGYEPDLICAECSPDYYSPDGHMCIPCPYGQHSGYGFSYCVECPPGTEWNWEKEYCVEIHISSFSSCDHHKKC